MRFLFGLLMALLTCLPPPPDGAGEDRNSAGAGHPSLDLEQLLRVHLKEQKEVLVLEGEMSVGRWAAERAAGAG